MLGIATAYAAEAAEGGIHVKLAPYIVGEVMGKYHPHGDASIYDTMVRMAQEWSMRYTMIDGQGNFGSQDGDEPAAMRYTEVRMQKFTEAMMDDIEKDGKLVLHWLAKGNHQGQLMKIPATGKNVFIHGMSILTFEKGKIIHGQVMWDLAGVLRQIGLLPEISQ